MAEVTRQLSALPRRNIPSRVSVHSFDGSQDQTEPRRRASPQHGSRAPRRNSAARVGIRGGDHSLRRGTIAEEDLQLLGGSNQRRRFCAEAVVLFRIRAELRFRANDGDGADDSVAVAVPEGRKLLEQEAVAVRVDDEAPGLLFPVLPRHEHEVSLLPPKRLLPAVGVEREILQRRRVVAADKIDDEPDVHEVVGVDRGGFLFQPAQVRRPRGAVVTGEV